MTTPPSSRARRRESTNSTAPNGSSRVRKNSTANNPLASGSMRPRANTISHVDTSALGFIAGPNTSGFRSEADMAFNHGLSGFRNHHYRGMSSATGHHGNAHVLPKLETRNHHMHVGNSLRTAPPQGGFGGDFNMEGMFYGPDTTVNPAQLHFTNSPHSFGFEDASSPFHQNFSAIPNGQDPLECESNFPWLSSFDQQMSFDNEQAVDNSSPSAVDSASPGTSSDMMLDASSNVATSTGWHNPMMSQAPFGQTMPFDLSAQPFQDPYSTTMVSPKASNLQDNAPDHFFSTPPPLSNQAPPLAFPGNQFYHAGVPNKPETPSNSAESISSSNRQSSVTSVSTDSITDATRQALLNSLSEPFTHGSGYMKTSQLHMSSPLSSGTLAGKTLPSTHDLQRFVAAYIRYFHPHLPFIHVASLSFDAPAFTNNLATSGHATYGRANITGGGGALILAMAAIGALYEFDFCASKDLFEMAKTMIQLYLQERRKADMATQTNAHPSSIEIDDQHTPLWLVQAMLLNVIYGHNSGDKTAAGIANTHCASLTSLARGAGLVRPAAIDPNSASIFEPLKQEDIPTSHSESSTWNGHMSHPSFELENEWLTWKTAEERKRSLYAIFILSSLLVSAYNSTPALMNSEILLDLPCDEHLWAAESAEHWRALGGSAAADQNAGSFASALSYLLTASQRPQQMQQMSQPQDLSSRPAVGSFESSFKPSTFGCLVLINAMHNYIWETRQRHAGRRWTSQESEAMHAHIEPALRAWQAAWSSNGDHSLARPNPYGSTSLSADCIPLLDLAYVRLHVNLGRSKELFFQRDWNGMAEELAHGSEIVQHAESSARASPEPMVESDNADYVKVENDASATSMNGEAATTPSRSECTIRERHLRKAAFCAANSLVMSDSLNVTFADYNSRELPLQSALCAFDCSQILAEWISTLQQRVGRFTGILGENNGDSSQASTSLFLDEDDRKLLQKIEDILSNAEAKLDRRMDVNSIEDPTDVFKNSGFGSKILSVHARMFERRATWPSK